MKFYLRKSFVPEEWCRHGRLRPIQTGQRSWSGSRLWAVGICLMCALHELFAEDLAYEMRVSSMKNPLLEWIRKNDRDFDGGKYMVPFQIRVTKP